MMLIGSSTAAGRSDAQNLCVRAAAKPQHLATQNANYRRKACPFEGFHPPR